MRGQFETEGTRDPGGYAAAALGADILAVMRETGARHLVGHSYGGLIGREAVLAAGGAGFASFTLMSSGPAALTGPRARELRAMLAALGLADEPGASPPPAAADLQAGIADIWRVHLEPQAVAAAVPASIVAFLGRRMLANDPAGLVLMARHMLAAPDRPADLARLDLPTLRLYARAANARSPAPRGAMAQRRRHPRSSGPAPLDPPPR